MALGKYYCDYCDKQFQDTASARKRHLLGLQHLRAKAQWYASSHSLPLQDTPTVAAATGFAKGLCNRFLNTGFCQYGDSCKYFHPNSTPQNSVTQAVVGSQFIEGSFLPSVIRDSMGMPWGNLPPSLKPPPEGGYLHLPFVDWG
ncbi:zf-CCCH domain-containing protein/zf-U1 domain-containing protein [Cephalotus follicularis]|uniref:Zf-CCCH domain-containing protein/zf-U1 domain-containing protein n=1 Tax=Cephalotus follicularis TaxID=3775 RepID=A0A1Q3BSG2_CEPFO|nr:zf-CCCH domain-containing protein/zf-U1 domain-containing protein [Cephalotus follicularis]